MHEKSVELLNKAIGDELAAIHQYMYFHFRLDDLGYTPWRPCSSRPPSRRWATPR